MITKQGTKPSEEDAFYITWGLETIKRNITLCNDIMKQLITINCALLGVTIIFDQILTNNILKILVLLSFFFSLIISFLGLLPYNNKVNIKIPEDIKSHKKNALKHKQRFLRASAFTITIGFGMIIGELIFRFLKN